MTAPRPMLAALADFALVDPGLLYEPKYDGIRALADVSDGGLTHIWSRRGNEKTAQFPDLAEALRCWAGERGQGGLLDGEIVALDAAGHALGFQRLQPRIHVSDEDRIGLLSASQPVAFMVFDMLRDGDEDLRELPLQARRERLERAQRRPWSTTLRLSEMNAGDGRELWRRAQDGGWEGIVAKEASAPYREGKRSPEWRKKKLIRQQEFVVGGWVDSPTGRPLGALMLGVYESERLIYVGHTGRGFSDRELLRVAALLAARTTRLCPFTPAPRSSRTFHWAHPDLVAQIRFSEWTVAGKLREPIYLGLRDDVRAQNVRREG